MAAFTLLEVLLTLAMSVVLMVLIGGIFQFYSRDMQSSDAEIRQIQLATSVMQMIEDDLRGTMYPAPVDTSGLAELLGSVGGSGSGSGSGGGSGSGSGGASDSAGEGDFGEEDLIDGGTSSGAATLDLAGDVTVLQKPGLIGNQYQIQFDISRLPRLEEYMQLLDGGTELQDLPSDLKSVGYFVQESGAVGGVADAFEDAGSAGSAGLATEGGGLVRRSLDRSATTHAMRTGGTARLNRSGEILAPEVVGIEFAYWDGYTWQIEWSSDGYGALPTAVRITLTMTAPGSRASVEGETRTYMHVVRLPLAKPIDMTETGTTGRATTGAGGTGMSGGSGMSGAGMSGVGMLGGTP